jgi:hypothetical protein
MLNAHIPAVKQQTLVGLCVFIIGLLLSWRLGGQIAAGDWRTVEFDGVLFRLPDLLANEPVLAVASSLPGHRRNFLF